MTLVMVAEQAGIPARTLERIAKGLNATVRPEHETAILAVTGPARRAELGGRVAIIGTRRRIGALMAASWPHEELTRRLGFATRFLMRESRRWVSQDVHDAVVALYDQIRGVSGPSDRTATQAASHGHVPPLAWVGVDMDDPKATPRPASDDDTLLLLRSGRSLDEAAARCGVEAKSVLTTLRRRARKAPGSRDAALHHELQMRRVEAGIERATAALRKRVAS